LISRISRVFLRVSEFFEFPFPPKNQPLTPVDVCPRDPLTHPVKRPSVQSNPVLFSPLKCNLSSPAPQ
jgi:hypothetical protein